jgi:hypothetical protein
MMSDTDAACVPTAFAFCVKARKKTSSEPVPRFSALSIDLFAKIHTSRY